MQQRQPRLGDVLDDYCPRERRLTNHAVVAMIGDEVKQTRCTACDAEHEYKHAKVPRQRRKTETPAALYAQVLASGPKKVTHDVATPGPAPVEDAPVTDELNDDALELETAIAASRPEPADADAAIDRQEEEDGPVHRPLIRASLPKIEGQQPPSRPIPEFTVRQPGGRQNRFRPRHQRGGGQQGQYGQRFSGDRSNGNSFGHRGGGMRPGGGRPPQGHMSSRPPRHGSGGPKRSK
ncbi:MAG: hypothetical protein HY048_15395 [Acidobacteria bacterium]|nr:hypothetical protein [Acidobacteriota bacterium]